MRNGTSSSTPLKTHINYRGQERSFTVKKSSRYNLIRWLVTRLVRILRQLKDVVGTHHHLWDVCATDVCWSLIMRKRQTNHNGGTVHIGRGHCLILFKSGVITKSRKGNVDHDLDVFSVEIILGTTGETWRLGGCEWLLVPWGWWSLSAT